jgi:hypothetical protein
MELAGRALDALVRNSAPDVREEVGLVDEPAISRARSIVRLGGLLHDAGHTPFSHLAEELFPVVNGRRLEHEHMTANIISQDEVATLLGPELVGPVTSVAVGPKFSDISDPQVAMLASLVTGVLGVDRMDYLLRDCLYTGVSYGAFDIHRIIATIKLTRDSAGGIAVALREEGHHVAEQMLLARWHMFHQVYLEPTRRIFDYHLTRYFRYWLEDHGFPGGVLPTDIREYLGITDADVTSDMYRSDHPDARALTRREHLRPVWTFEENDFEKEDDAKRFQEGIRTKFPSVHFDNVSTSFTKPGDGEIWIDSPGGARTLEEMSLIVRTLRSTRIRRAYAPIDERGDVIAEIGAEMEQRRKPWFGRHYPDNQAEDVK